LRSFPDNLLKDYEDLRSYVLDSICGFSRPLGLDLFLKKGFLKWMHIQAESEVYRKPVEISRYNNKRERIITEGFAERYNLAFSKYDLRREW